MSLINCKIHLILILSKYCINLQGNKVSAFTITDRKIYVPVATLSTQDNTKLLQ